MRLRGKRIVVVLAIICVLLTSGVTWLGYTFLSPNSYLNRPSAIDASLTWGRLAPFPASAKDISISTEGGMFTRAFRVSFVASEADIDRWLQQSPGPHQAVPSSPSPGMRHFEIEPGGGAEHAEVTVDDTKHRVWIYVYWS